ncbi:L-serine ammonia-lyase, iron-sulfur-dependent, subunit alpha [Ihubacter massiliensis]|uniref:UPF0597 protein OBO34_06305 n=1 Tax=Hominibacterium faecale TaxID=2839743 RepID=A0A9J6QRE1_9FIRM|nr:MULTISPECIES: L-serine ammonia-lyase, iron-sulfur-dependent, subunit alpha [Eubacteriales Family XIII. Incertae Sedis]MCC2865229.1 L-serine ammonia-lyase, iron-sulfur-dependent, subunit alpha [Anaerovorax odorimutans]MCI7300314.1 L-serine ammonia-lyase, iron-sulfur-dependent, subunit alpha [Clostridia bacterium]MDE8732765.1 L-serine ammonia-lyase, iron-sulfur-dependent, subunit alpha [Eubacteriales bacterium DFI.9.88]MDY3011588.1 L-serine ammonia-lyase, iron-sulfur-dependent, subunit alpha [
MNGETAASYRNILENELILALGCTEPGALAYAAAKAVEILKQAPERMTVSCSGNIIKNVKGVYVPNSGGLRGVEAAAVLGAVIGDPSKELNVLEEADDEDRRQARQLLASDFCICELQEGEDNLYIDVSVFAGTDSSRVIIKNAHTNIVFMERNGRPLLAKEEGAGSCEKDEKASLNITDIIEFADCCDLAPLKELLERQIEVNCAIAQAGLDENYGACVGKTLMETGGNCVQIRAKAKAAAGSDARMGGSCMPVMINSGSGNQGITVTVPVVEYAEELQVSREKLCRALIVSNLISIHIKYYIGKLSAFCGAVSAACGSGAAITYMHGGTLAQISSTIVNTLADVGGIVCDGAKASCAAKIASAVDAAIMAHNMSMRSRSFQAGEGFITEDIETTIANMGYIGREGMKTTDVEILKLMLANRVL